MSNEQKQLLVESSIVTVAFLLLLYILIQLCTYIKKGFWKTTQFWKKGFSQPKSSTVISCHVFGWHRSIQLRGWTWHEKNLPEVSAFRDFSNPVMAFASTCGWWRLRTYEGRMYPKCILEDGMNCERWLGSGWPGPPKLEEEPEMIAYFSWAWPRFLTHVASRYSRFPGDWNLAHTPNFCLQSCNQFF